MGGSKILGLALLAAVAVNAPGEPLITSNPDGTFAIQKPPAKGDSKGGLVIPPQTVVPIVPHLPPDGAKSPPHQP